MGRSRTELTIETSRTVVIRKRHLARAWCPDCECEVDGIAPCDLAAFLETTDLSLQNDGFSGSWHFIEVDGEKPLICLESLRRLR